MPITIPSTLPAREILNAENIFIMDHSRAIAQDIRSLKFLILNLMPKKIETETQLLRLIGNTPIQIDVDLLQTSTHVARNTAPEHLLEFYHTFPEIQQNFYDALIITGAPVENLAFEEVDYWSELCKIFEWSKTNVFSTMHICWGAQAGLYYHYGIDKHPVSQKVFGVFSHKKEDPSHPLLYGFDDTFFAPHSRHTEILAEDILQCPSLNLLSRSPKAGVYLISSRDNRHVFLTGHPEYDRTTLDSEYKRDLQRGLSIAIPANYYPHNNPENLPVMRWRSHSSLLFSNWINYFVYQQTPYDFIQPK